MKNKNIIITVLAVVILVIVVLMVYSLVNNNSKDAKKDSKKEETSKETKYEVKDQYFDTLVINNIEVEIIDDQTIVSFAVTNNSSEAYPGGVKVLNVESSNIVVEKVQSNISSINPGQTIDMEIVINGKYDNIDAIVVE